MNLDIHIDKMDIIWYNYGVPNIDKGYGEGLP